MSEEPFYELVNIGFISKLTFCLTILFVELNAAHMRNFGSVAFFSSTGQLDLVQKSAACQSFKTERLAVACEWLFMAQSKESAKESCRMIILGRVLSGVFICGEDYYIQKQYIFYYILEKRY